MIKYLILGVVIVGCSDAQDRDSYENDSLKKAQSEAIASSSLEPLLTETKDSQQSTADANVQTESPVERIEENVSGALETRSESAAPPVQISGAFLTCANLLETSANESLNKSTIACRLVTSGGDPFHAETINSVARYRVIPNSTAPGVTVKLRAIKNPSRKYDAIIEFTASNDNDSKVAAATSTIVADLNDMTSGVLVSHWEATTNSLMESLDKGLWFTAGGAVSYMDAVTSQWWARDDTVLYTYANAVTHCNNLIVDGRNDWRLPSIDELKIASSDGLAYVYNGPDYLNINTVAPAFYWSSSPISATQAYGYAPKDLESPGIQANMGTLHNVMCLHD